MLQLPFTLIDKDTFITLNYTTDAKQIKKYWLIRTCLHSAQLVNHDANNTMVVLKWTVNVQ